MSEYRTPVVHMSVMFDDIDKKVRVFSNFTVPYRYISTIIENETNVSDRKNFNITIEMD